MIRGRFKLPFQRSDHPDPLYVADVPLTDIGRVASLNFHA